MLVMLFAVAARAAGLPTPTAAAPAATPSAPLYGSVTRTVVLPPSSQIASATGTAGAAITLLLPQVAGFTTMLYGFDVTCGAPTATANGLLTVTGILGAATYQVAESSTAGAFLAIKQVPLAQASPATPIVLSLGAVSGGAACSINAFYSFQD
jgi:hypothetical protein